jgi:predicted transcriptional regulator
MGTIGSYVLSTRDRSDADDVDLQTASTQVLKTLGSSKGPVSVGALLSSTSLSESQLRDALQLLVKNGLVINTDDLFMLTDLGYKATLIVA